MFAKAARLLRRRKLVPEKECEQFEAVVGRLEQMEAQAQNANEMLGDVPEEYLDPLLQTVMTDPVILPHSKVRMERSVILRHLLNDSCDPFTRQPLTPDMLQPDAELKAKIEEYIRTKTARGSVNSLSSGATAETSTNAETATTGNAATRVPRRNRNKDHDFEDTQQDAFDDA